MSENHPDVLFVPYDATRDLLDAPTAMRLCEDVFLMHARSSVVFSAPKSLRMDVAAPYNNHWHVKAAQLSDVPVTGLRLYNYHDDGVNNNVGQLDCTRYVILSDPRTGHALAIVDEHWSYAIRSAAAAVAPLKHLGPKTASVLALIGCGTMCSNALLCLSSLYRFDEVRVTSRRRETRDDFAALWSNRLGIAVTPVETPEAAVTGADIVVGGTTSADVFCKASWLKPGVTFISLARRELDPADWRKMDKIVVDDWGFSVAGPVFRQSVEAGHLSREDVYAELPEIMAQAKPGRTAPEERILLHTSGLVSQDLMIAHWLYEQAKDRGLAIRLPTARSFSPTTPATS